VESKSYQEGIQEGKLLALEVIQGSHSDRLNRVEGRVATLERVAYTLIGAIALIQFAPALKSFIN